MFIPTFSAFLEASLSQRWICENVCFDADSVFAKLSRKMVFICSITQRHLIRTQVKIGILFYIEVFFSVTHFHGSLALPVRLIMQKAI
jgi:hypothetical protein